MENNTEKNLNLLLELQNIDKQVQEILQVRGSLPQEVKRLEQELAHLKVQKQTYQEEISALEQDITALRVKIKEIEVLVKRYEEQQANVRNNREYDAITKEIELHNLDIQLAEKKIREHYEHIERNKHKLVELDKSIEEATRHFKEKQEALDAIVAESQEEENKLAQQRQEIQSKIDQPLLQMYEKIRNHVQNKLAVVVVKRGACEGCFTTIYPQLQAEIKDKRQIYQCEHCGRILADVAESITIISAEEDNQLEQE